METLEHFQSQVKERLMEFRRLTQKSPAHIVVFRDGVSDSQFKITMEQEVSSIQRACSSLSDKYKPTITFMVVQKRHQVRFYEPSRKFDRQGGNAGNLKNGTIIDRDIINPELFDFYAVLHRGILGTSRPCHIYVLYDDWALPAEYVYLLSYYMAYVCTRCESPIGIPAPCYYADLACTRMKNHWMINKSTTKSSMSNGLPELHDNIKNEQFFV
uniref:Piwi domain-containing protein n=1 Tax=Rhabditophanes sp. KR3021 TaxID=114890 RepID=A0AC35TIA3_9BILA